MTRALSQPPAANLPLLTSMVTQDLLHRGYPIEQLAEKSDYLELCYLLLNGELPNAEDKDNFVYTIKHHTMVNEQLRSFFKGFRPDAHPMAIMCSVIGALSSFYHDSLDIDDPQHRMITAHRLIAKMPTLAAMSYKHAQGQPFIYPRNDLGYAAPAYDVRHPAKTMVIPR